MSSFVSRYRELRAAGWTAEQAASRVRREASGSITPANPRQFDQAYRQSLKRIGKAIAKICADDVDDESQWLIDRLAELPRKLRQRALSSIQDSHHRRHVSQLVVWCDEEGEFALRDDCQEHDGEFFTQDYFDDNFARCDDCGDTVRLDDTTSVGDSCVCDCCLSSNYTRCDDCGDYTHDDEITNVQGDHVCNSCIESGSYYFWESDQEYHTEPETQSGLPGYHDQTRPSWWKSPHVKHRVAENTPCFGVELELDCSDIPALLERIGNLDVLAEEDGSLKSDTGVELIGGPYTLEQYQNGETPWSKIDFADCRGHDAHTANRPYGIHVSVNRASFASELHASKFVVFLNQAEKLGKLIAQRDQIFNGKYKCRCKCGKQSLATSKYEPAHVGKNRIEVRIFRSNLRVERITKNVEYVAAAQAYCRLASMAEIADEQSATSGFISFLGKNAKHYPNLAEFLRGSSPDLMKWNEQRERKQA